MLAIASNGYFAIYLPDENPGTPGISWLVLGIIGAVIIGLKTLRLPKEGRFQIVIYDLIYLLILLFFALFSLPFGINFIIGSILAVLFLRYQIDPNVLVHLD